MTAIGVVSRLLFEILSLCGSKIYVFVITSMRQDRAELFQLHCVGCSSSLNAKPHRADFGVEG